MAKKLSVSVGIPALNEELNIKQLLTAILRQEEDSFVLREIIVVSDGSTDETVALAKSIKDKRIRVINAGNNQLLLFIMVDFFQLVFLDYNFDGFLYSDKTKACRHCNA